MTRAGWAGEAKIARVHHHTVPLAKLIPLAHDPLVVAACRHLADDFKRIGYSEIRLHDSAYHVAFVDDLCTVERRVGTGTLQALVEGWVLADVGAWLTGEITEVRLATEGGLDLPGASATVEIADDVASRGPVCGRGARRRRSARPCRRR